MPKKREKREVIKGKYVLHCSLATITLSTLL